MKETFLTWLNRLLVADVFLVLFAFLWFAVAVIGHSIGFPLGFDLWYKLWQPVFNPAIGILFLGAFLSWLIGKISKQFDTNSN
ncbi:hypothetical protein [Aphanothece sacrum]|uniref:Uncharacterized protein n=1 Tax=Aphanothece sacrum FPU1 TaxID=1920663 RepID=A0A401IC21_APHSA|nr:hypothetical protein [Aphanothece sacrum]GBF78771.1 hypothetical protein AsFPU1_0160 [Aphanothece sacrum FPU1]GBF83003.1 hypothetical protein AsFPU3_0040 [Aphanothece sacrum FPU3]